MSSAECRSRDIRAFSTQDRIDAAVERFSRAARLDPRDPDALLSLALAQKAGGRTEEAKESLLEHWGWRPTALPRITIWLCL